MTYSANRYLTMAEMKVNAEYIYGYLNTRGWTKNSICGMLGNMQTESTINPGIWQSLKLNNFSGGFGLVQWTPATKYTNWCDSNGLRWGAIDSNLLRIQYEVLNNLQWIHPSMDFADFVTSNDSPYNLGLMFLKYYERPANPNQPQRGTQAEFWYEYLTGKPSGGGGGTDGGNGGQLPPASVNENSLIDLLLVDALYGWKK